MKIAPLALSAAVLIGLSACSGSATESSPDTMDQATATPEATDTPRVTEEPVAAAQETTETAPESQPPSEPDADPVEPEGDLPSRDEMEPWERTYAEAFYVNRIREQDIGQLHTDDELIAAGDAACDALDGGKPIRGVLVDVAEATPRLENVDATAVLAGAAAGILCPEHAPE